MMKGVGDAKDAVEAEEDMGDRSLKRNAMKWDFMAAMKIMGWKNRQRRYNGPYGDNEGGEKQADSGAQRKRVFKYRINFLRPRR